MGCPTATSFLSVLVAEWIFITFAGAEPIIVQMPPQIEDAEDPCHRRYHVELDDTCASVASLNQIKVEELIFLNPGLKCNRFFTEIDLCVDRAATGRLLDDANYDGLPIPSTQDVMESVAYADTPAVEADIIDTGTGKR